MIIANFEGNESVKYVSGLYQYNKEQILQITGLNLPRVVEIDFSLEETGATSKSCPAITKDGITEVMIPNEMLVNQDTDMNYNIYAFVYVTDASTSETVKRIVMQVRARTKPEQFEALGNRELFEKAINEVNNSADRAETAANTSEQNAKKTAEDRKAIEEMVETVSGIEQQVQDVKKYAGQAETAASNAALSEQKAKESETAALQAKTDAETAKGSAETAAGKTAEDRTAVESVKEEVLQAKQQVSADRAKVEAVERKVAQMGNAIPQAVLEGVQAVGSAGAAEKQGIVQAGTEQKSAVESAGTKAVENINLAKKSATDAVETAKTGAVGAVGTAGAEQTQSVTEEGEKQVKAVADKGAEVLQSIPEDFVTQMQNKLDKQQGAENAGKAMVINPEGVIVPGEVTGGDGIPIINTASGESPLVVSDSAERVNKGLSIIGNTEQLTTTGANLFDEKKLLNFNDPNYDKSNASKGAFYYKFKADEQVTVSVTKLNKDGEYLCVGAEPDGSDAYWLSHKSAATNTFKTLTPKDGYIYLGVGTTLERVENMIRKTGGIMINHGSDAMPYEPYTGGKPSPSPEYPQEIKNVGKWNPETQKYEVDIRITNAKESWDKEQTLTLTSDRPITKWDKLVEKDGEIGWLYGSKRYKVTGNESFESRGGYNGDSYTNRFFMLNDMQTDETYSKPIAYVETLNHVLYCYAPDINKEGFDTNIKQFHIKISNDRVGILISDDHAVRTAKFSEYMKKIHKNGNPIEILYATTDMVFLPLAKSEQDAIRALKTYYPTTAITVDGGEVVPTVELTYTADTKNFILNREKVMQAQMLNIQSALISQKISGGGIKVTDSSSLPIEEFSMSGKTVQNGTPTPTNPVDIEVTPQGIITVDFTDGTNHQIVELNCPREFTKWDRLEKIDGVWNWVFKAIKDTDVKQSRFDLFGWNHATQYKDFKNGVYAYAWSFKNKEKGWQTSICKQFKNENGSYDKGILWHYSDNPAMDRQYFVTNHKTVEEFEAWVEANPLTMYFEGKETEYVPLLQEEQDKLNALTMYAPNTEITNTGGCNMEFTYTVDTKSYVDSKILTLSKALL